MTSIPQVYEAVKNVVATTGLRAFSYVPGSAEWPGAYLMPPQVVYEGLADNVLEFDVGIVILVSAATDKNQLQLLAYMDDQGDKSIPLAFHNNPGLGLDGVHAFVRMSRPLNFEEMSAYAAFGALLEVSIRLT